MLTINYTHVWYEYNKPTYFVLQREKFIKLSVFFLSLYMLRSGTIDAEYKWDGGLRDCADSVNSLSVKPIEMNWEEKEK